MDIDGEGKECGDDGQFIDYRTLCARLESILDNAHDQMVRAQTAYAAFDIDAGGAGQELKDIQGLDLATQTVAAVREILLQASSMSDPHSLSVAELVGRVTLADVANKISGSDNEFSSASGDAEFF